MLAVVRAARRFERQGDTEMELVARCMVLAVVAFMSADFFLSGEFSKQLWLTFALCPAVLALSGGAGGAEDTPVSAPGRARDPAYRPQPAY
jgi:peptidoglycan/LPS O-acetylase OafA/YrhL